MIYFLGAILFIAVILGGYAITNKCIKKYIYGYEEFDIADFASIEQYKETNEACENDDWMYSDDV